MYSCIRRTLSRSLRRSRGCGADGFAPTYVIHASSAARFLVIGDGPLSFWQAGRCRARMPASPAAPGAAWPGEVRARRRSPRFGSRLRALHICVGRLRYRRACGAPVRACSAAAAGPGARGGIKTRLKTSYSPTCVRLVFSPSNACPLHAPACIVLPRAAPRRAAARTPRTGYCGRRRRSDRPFRTGLQRWLEEEEIPPQAPVFHEFLESIYLNFKVLFWTESSILAQDERWRRA